MIQYYYKDKLIWNTFLDKIMIHLLSYSFHVSKKCMLITPIMSMEMSSIEHVNDMIFREVPRRNVIRIP